MKLFSLTFVAFFVTAAFLYANNDLNESAAVFKVDPAISTVVWNAKKAVGGHYGNVKIAEGQLSVKNGTLEGGVFTIDMSSITCEDVTNESSNNRLVNHLKSDDFFGVDKHPISKLVVKKVDRKTGDQYEITGDLTIKDITQEIVFPATMQLSGNKITANADISVDRTKYDIKLRSGKFFENLGDRLIHDDFTLTVNLIAAQEIL